MPKVSVIIPIYNVEEYLDKCLNSVVNQTLKDIEIILIDNGSNLIEKGIIKSYQKLDSRIQVIDFINNVGYGKAVNEGIKNANGMYISIIESDDYVDLNMLEELYESAEQYNIDVIKSAYYEFDSKNEIVRLGDLDIPENITFKLTDYSTFLMEHPSIWSCLYNTKFLKNNHISFIEKLGTAWVDNPFQLETLYVSNKILYTSKPYYHYRFKRDGNSSSLKEGINIPYDCVKDMDSIIKKYNINNPNILYHLSRRIITYIQITISKINLKNFNIGFDAIYKMIEIIDSYKSNDKMILNYKNFKNKNFLLLYILKKKISHLLESILYIKISKKSPVIKNFNIMVYKSGVKL